MGLLFGRNDQDNIIMPYEDEPYETNILTNSLGEITLFPIIGVVVIGTIILIICFARNYCNKNDKDNKKKFLSNIMNDDNDDNYNYNNNTSLNKNKIYNNRQERKFKKDVEMDIFNNNVYGNKNNINNKINSITSINKNERKKRNNNNQNNNNYSYSYIKNTNNINNINNIYSQKKSNNRIYNNNQYNNIYDNSLDNNINIFNNNNINNNIINNINTNLINNNNNKNNVINNFNNNKRNSKTEIYLSDSDSSERMLKENGFIVMKIQREPKIGLGNIGATCYMNATLQCLSHTIKLANYFLNKKKEKKIKQKNFSREFLEIIKRLWLESYNNNKTYYEPYSFKKKISEMNPLFEGVQANDAKDLINFILQELHEELNEPEKNSDNNSFNIDQYNERQMFINFIDDFKKSQRSIISDIFFFIIETKTECLNCKQRNIMNGIYSPIYLYNFQIMNFLIFPLEEVRKYKIMQYQQNFQEVNLTDCFNYNQKVDFMQGENQMWCKNCQQNSPSQYMTLIYSAPVDLILILNRGKGNIYNVKLNFDEILDIGNYVYMKKNQKLIYHLYAVVTHIGPSDMGGHFIAFCKSPIDNQWYKYNDAIVELVGSFQDIVNFGVPYILFYEAQNL